MNLSEHLNLFYNLLKSPDTNRYPLVLAKEFLDQAERIVNKRSKTIRASSIDDSVSNQRLYSFPTDILDWQLRQVYYSVTNSTERRRLTPVTLSQLDSFKRDWRETTGTPKFWYLDKEQKKYGVYPYEKTIHTGTNCIELLYRKKHTKMTHYYIAGTITIVNGATAVAGGSTAFIGNVIADDELGIGKLLDRSTDFPTAFYGISATPTSDTALVLSSAFAEASVAAKNYIISSPSLITNEELNMCSILWAMSLAKKKDGDRNASVDLQNECLARIEDEIVRLEEDAVMDETITLDGSLPYPGSQESDYS